MRTLSWMVPALLLSASAYAAPAQTPAGPDVNARLQRVERLLDSQALMDMLTRLDGQQRELQQMRGMVEELRHELDTLKQRQRDLYLDTDRRLSRIEREGGAAAPAATLPSVGAPQAAVTPAATAPAANTATTATMTASVENTAAPADLAAEREAYQKAFDVLRELRYDQAVSAFEGFLAQYPDGRYAHIAQYWLGEANYARREYPQAIAAYEGLMQKHPASPKVAEAMLKVAYSHYELGKPEAAKPVLEQLLSRYPGTTEAGQAESLLKRIKRQ